MTFAADYGLIETPEQLERLVAKLLLDGRPFGFDIETGYDGEPREKAQLHPEEGKIAGISLTNSGSWARYVPLAHDSGPNVGPARAAELLWPLMQTRLGVAHNAKFELRFLSRWFAACLSGHPEFGPQVKESNGYFPVRSDTVLELHAEGKSRSLKLKDSTLAIFGHQMMTIEELFALCADGVTLTKRQRDSMNFCLLDLMGEHRQDIIGYACEDALWALRHHGRLYEQVRDNSRIYKLEMAVLPVVCEMEDEGVLLDWAFYRDGSRRARLFKDKLLAEIQADLAELLAERGIEEPCQVSLASPVQLAHVLYDQLGLPVKRTSHKTGNPSTDKLALEELRRLYPVVQKIINWKKLTKLDGTYLSVYESRYSYALDGRTHPNVIQTAVGAGRFAVSDWPYQQSPKKYRLALRSGEEFRFSFRDGVLAPDGWYILGYDYSQIELRVMAGEARETALIEAFRNGEDVHRKTASLMLGVPLGQVTGDQRTVGKTMNFALGYQMGEEGLADRLAITRERAAALFAQYFATYAKIKGYLERVIAQAKREGCVYTRFGRRVPVWDLQAPLDGGYVSRRRAKDGERLAGNAPIQGGAADYMKLAMVRARRALARAGMLDRVRLVMNIHDALEFYVRADVDPLEVIRVLQPAVVFTTPEIAHWPPMEAVWHTGSRWGSVTELAVELDGAGVPVALSAEQDSPAGREAGPVEADIEGEEVPDVSAVAGLAGDVAVAPESFGGISAGNGAGTAPPATVTVALDGMPARDDLRRFRQAVRERPGGNTLVLQSPQGQKRELPERTGYAARDQAELEMLLGVSIEVTAEFASPVQALMA